MLTVGFALAGMPGLRVAAAQGAAPRMLDPKQVDAFLAVNGDGTSRCSAARSISAPGLRIAMRQILAEELGMPIARIKMIEGDTALTPDQGRTAGSNGIQRGGMQIRQAAATARKALIELAAKQLNVAAADLVAADGEVRPKAGGAGVKFADLLAGNKFDLAARSQGAAQGPAHLHHRRQAAAAAGRAGQGHRQPHLSCTTSPCPACCTAASSGRPRSAPSCARSTSRRSRICPA